MRILLITNNRSYNYKLCPRGWVALPHYFSKMGHEVKLIGKKQILMFPFYYLMFKPDVVVSSWVPAGFIPALMRKMGLVRCPLVHAWDDYYVEAMPAYPSSIVGLMERFTVKNSDCILTVLKGNLDNSRSLGKRVYFMPMGRTSGSKETKIRLEDYMTDKRNLKVIYLGEQTTYKNVDKIIRAASGLKIDLFLFGKINPDFQGFASSNVHFMGYADPDEVISVLKQGDILVNPSNLDGNFKFFDYIHAKKSIIAYDGRPRNLFTHLKNAYLTTDFREAIVTLGKNKALRDKLARNVAKMRTFTWEEVAKKYLDVLKFVAKRDYARAEKASAWD